MADRALAGRQSRPTTLRSRCSGSAAAARDGLHQAAGRRREVLLETVELLVELLAHGLDPLVDGPGELGQLGPGSLELAPPRPGWRR